MISIPDGAGQPHDIPLLGYVDDLALLADTPEQLQQGLGVVEKWAAKVRMRINIGAEKSAIMIVSKGRIPDKLWDWGWAIAGNTLPVVTEYKYLGVLLSNRGSWDRQVRKLKSKVQKRTGEIIRCSRDRAVTTDISARLWALAMDSAALSGAGIWSLSATAKEDIDRIQRKAGRAILGHCSQSPSCSVLLELGWVP